MQRHALPAALIALALLAVPAVGGAAGAGQAAAPAGAAKVSPAAPSKLVDINSASRAELETLPGIDAATAQKIVAGRPYFSKAQLVTDNVVPAGPYHSLKHLIIARQKTPSKSKNKTG